MRVWEVMSSCIIHSLRSFVIEMEGIKKYLCANRNFMSSISDFGEISQLLQLISRGVLYIKLTEGVK